MPDNRERLIVALDVSSAARAREIVAAIGESAFTYKVGKQLFTAEGPQVVRDLATSGRKVFLDLKFHDIPTTVGKAVAEAIRLGVSMLTVHASGGSRMLHAAAEAVSAAKSPPLLLGVTVLTSLNQEDLPEIGVSGTVVDQALRLASLALSSGCKGIVASARETSALRREFGSGFAIVNPGVRPAGQVVDDQARVVTPAEAVVAGASHIVVGRPITQAADPGAAARAIIEEISLVPAGKQ